MQTLILGFDAFDPVVFERLSQQGRLPNLTRYAEAGGYVPLAVPDPPQSEVSWTSIATGLNPGGHGIFDFVHRDPQTYALQVSLLPTKKGLGGTQFVPPFGARTIFDMAARQGYPATALWWPATFPARPESPVRTIPGLGTPDILGKLGVGTLFSTGDGAASPGRKTPIRPLEAQGRGHYTALLPGPVRKTRQGLQASTLPLELEVGDGGTARLFLGGQAVDLIEGAPPGQLGGRWSPILELKFKIGRFVSVQALTRATLTRLEPEVQLYLLPLQIHPLHAAWRYASPRGFVKDAWQACGPWLTLGWPQDTTGLEEGCMGDEQFLALCDSILAWRECLLMHHLASFREGVLAAVFDSLDRVQHMFWRDRPEVVEGWYVELDGLLGRVEGRLAELGQEGARIVVVSDHGFADLDYKVHLNRWLLEQGYLAAREQGGTGSLRQADWARSQAYALGLNSLYLNLDGREGQGSVAAGEREALLDQLADELLAWRGPDGRPVVQEVRRQTEAFDGPLAAYGPDLVVGYSRGYRASAETGLGAWEEASLESNGDHWGADHCMAAAAVPGVVFCNQGLGGFPNPSYRDMPALTIGAEPDTSSLAPPPRPDTDEDEAVVEERLRSLGYL